MLRLSRRRAEHEPQEAADALPGPELAADSGPPDPDLPAGIDSADATSPESPGFVGRGRMRRRLRYLRRARELGFRDLGGLVFELRRFEREREDLVAAKVQALASVDRELRALEDVLGDRRLVSELREAGVASCPRCSTLHGSEARFCPSCGLALRGARPIGTTGEVALESAPLAADGPAASAAPPSPPPDPGQRTVETPTPTPTSAAQVRPEP